MARSFGIVLILATQNPKAEVLNALIWGNLSIRITFRTATPEHSQNILGVVTSSHATLNYRLQRE